MITVRREISYYIPGWVVSQFHCNGAGVFVGRKYSTPLKLIGYLRRVGWFAKLPANIIVERSRSLCNPSMIPWKKILIHRNFAVTLCTEGSILCVPGETRSLVPGNTFRYRSCSTRSSLTLGILNFASRKYPTTAFESADSVHVCQKRVEIGEQYPFI